MRGYTHGEGTASDTASDADPIEHAAFLRALMESTSDAIFVVSEDSRITGWNEGAVDLSGYTREEALGRTPEFLTPADLQGEMTAALECLRRGDKPEARDGACLHKDGTRVPVSLAVTVVRDDSGGVRGALIVARPHDISRCDRPDEAVSGVASQMELERTNEALLRSERAFAALSRSNQTLVRATDEARLMHDVCDAVVTMGGYRLAWVGMMAHDGSHRVVPVAWAGAGGEILRDNVVTWDDSPTGQGSVGRCIRSNQLSITRDTVSDPRFVWKEAVFATGYRSLVAFPLTADDGGPFGALTVYSTAPDAFDQRELTLLGELARDLAFGICSIRARERQARAEVDLIATNAQLEQMVYEVAEAMGKIVEARDPYTKGHEVRVSKLGEMIALEMGCSPDEVAAVAMASLLHDIGKLRVPTEILTKPGRISGPEFALIKEHSRAGYDILKDISFPYPVADIVLQHHERMDGSGYPNGLTGDEMLSAARILAVSDVVEAMASYRPYRAALGTQAAIAEVVGNPSLYDAGAVAACLRLYGDGRLAFLDASDGR